MNLKLPLSRRSSSVARKRESEKGYVLAKDKRNFLYFLYGEEPVIPLAS